MYVPDFGVDAISGDYDFDEATDDVIQHLYGEARDVIEEELNVEIELPTTHDVVFKYSGEELENSDYRDVSVDLQYAETGAENFVIRKEDEDPVHMDEDEFQEKVSERVLQRLKKAITIYSQIVKAQQKCVSQDVLEKYL